MEVLHRLNNVLDESINLINDLSVKPTPGYRYMLVELCSLYLLANGLIDQSTCDGICNAIEEETGFGSNESESYYINRNVYIEEIKRMRNHIDREDGGNT